jgi:hypothetical protein
MTAKNPAALEAEQEVLAVSLHCFEATPVEALGDSGGTGPRMHRLDGQLLAHENAQPRRRPMDGVTFGH